MTKDFANWLEETIPERKIHVTILQLHEQQLVYYNTIKAENFIESLQDLWETNTVNTIKLEQDIQQDWLHYAIKMCTDKLPPKLPQLNENALDFGPEKSVAFALYQVNISNCDRLLLQLIKFIIY